MLREIIMKGALMPDQLRGRLVLVDAPSLYHIGLAIGIRTFWYKHLFKVLIKKIGEFPCSCKAAYFVGIDNHVRSVKRYLKDQGVTTVAFSRVEEVSDFIIQKIQETNPREIAEIVLVGANGKYAPYLLKKKKEDIHIFVAATRLIGPQDTRRMLSSSLEQEEFSFIELKQYEAFIMKERKIKQERSVDHQAVPAPPLVTPADHPKSLARPLPRSRLIGIVHWIFSKRWLQVRKNKRP